MELAVQLFSDDKTVGNDTVNDLKEFNAQSISLRAKKKRRTTS